MRWFLTFGRGVCRAFWLAVFGALLLTGPAGMALQLNATRSSVRAAKSAAPVHAATPAQQRLTAAAATEGVQIEWNVGLGSPFSIRGQDLGARKAFSAGKGLAVAGSAAPEEKAIAVLDNLSGIMGVRDAQEEFAALAVQTDTLGFQHVRATQTYQGLKVFGGKLIVHFDQDGKAYQVNGRYVPDITVDLNPQFTSDDAVGRAATDLAALGLAGGAVLSPPELVIFAYQSQPRLAYALTLTAEPPEANAWRYWIDARNGSVLLRYNDVKSVDISGVILTGEGGTTKTVTNCVSAGINNYLWSTHFQWLVYNWSTNSTSYSDATNIAFRTSNNWGTSDRMEMSAAVNFDYIQRYFYYVHGRNSYNTNGALAIAFVHFFDNYWGAFWNGYAFYFGDGDGVYRKSLAVLDVCGHEFTHAVTEYSANLIYVSESGALNESFSDIFGTIIEFFYQPDSRTNYPNPVDGKADWLIGEDCSWSSRAISDMRNPSNPYTVGEAMLQPNHYHGPYWYDGDFDNGGVHINSGVQNYFFYLLSEGGTNVYGATTTIVSGIGITNAARIAYRTLTTYCYEFTDYTEVRSAWISAAQDLNTAWVASVTQAWEAVGYGNSTLANLGTALDATYLTWYTSGSSEWFAQANTTYDDVSAAQSGLIENNQLSRLQTTFSGKGIFSFWWKVSSQWTGDYLRFYIDGVELDKITGPEFWWYYAYTNFSGTRTATWLYTKDRSIADYEDAGWVDQVDWATLPSTTVVASDGTYTDKVRIIWSAVDGATAYEVWRGTRIFGTFTKKTKLGETAGTLLDDTDAIAETVYYYWVKAKNDSETSGFSTTGSDSGWRADIGIQPDVKINEADGTITMQRGADLRVAILLMTSSTIDADWWFIVATPGGWYYYDADAGTWLSFTDLATLHPSYQGPLFDFLAPVEIISINTSWLLPGVYVIYFGVDTTMNGILDDTLYYDSSTLNLVE